MVADLPGPVEATGHEAWLAALERAAAGQLVVHFLSDKESVPFGDLWVEAVARSRQLTPGTCLAMLVEASRESLVTLLAGWAADLTVASLPLPGRGQNAESYAEHLMGIMGVLDVQQAWVPARYRALLPEDLLLPDDSPWELPTADPGLRSSFIQFTSGSTSDPRGVVIPVGTVHNHVTDILTVIDPPRNSVAASWLPLSHDMGLVGIVLSTLLSADPAGFGARSLYLWRPDDFLRSPGSWLRLCSETQTTVTAAPPFALTLATRAKTTGLDLSALRALIVGGDTLQPVDLRRFEQRLGPAGLGNRSLCPAYGLAEATLAVSICGPGFEWRTHTLTGSTEDTGPLEVVSCGAPVGTARLIVRTDDGLPVTTDDGVGEIVLSGGSIATGYLDRGGVSAFNGLFETGDIGSLPSGEVVVLGRNGARLLVNGRTFWASDIEAAAARVEGVRAGCVAAVQMSGGVVVAYEEARPGAGGVDRMIVSTIREQTGLSVNAIPVARGRLRKTSSGKLQRTRIAQDLRALT